MEIIGHFEGNIPIIWDKEKCDIFDCLSNVANQSAMFHNVALFDNPIHQDIYEQMLEEEYAITDF